MKKLDQFGKKIVVNMTNGGRFGWPPDCTGFIYQPERPVEKTHIDTAATVENIEVKDIRKK